MFKNKEYVLSVYKEGSFTRAAEKLFVSQPSLSASIKRIEDKIGAPVFDRSSTPVRLTEIGREYVRSALAIAESERGFERYLADQAGLMSGKVRIGGSSFFCAFVIPELISKFGKRHSKISFEIVEDSTKHLLSMLDSGEIDLVIDNATVSDASVASVEYIREQLLLAAPKRLEVNKQLQKYALSAEDVKNNLHIMRKAVPLERLSGEKFILLHSENDTGKRAEALLSECGIVPDILFRLDQQITAYNVCASGMGIAFVSDTLVKQIGADPDILYYTLPNAERSICFFTKRNRYQTLACRRFIEESTNE